MGAQRPLAVQWPSPIAEAIADWVGASVVSGELKRQPGRYEGLLSKVTVDFTTNGDRGVAGYTHMGGACMFSLGRRSYDVDNFGSIRFRTDLPDRHRVLAGRVLNLFRPGASGGEVTYQILLNNRVVWEQEAIKMGMWFPFRMALKSRADTIEVRFRALATKAGREGTTLAGLAMLRWEAPE